MPLKIGVLFCVSLLAGFAYYKGSHAGVLARAATPVGVSQESPPSPKPTPVEDTSRYVAWMKKQGKPISDRAHEDVSLRVGEWGFFYHGDRPVGSWTPLRDRTALDASGHAVTESENGDWSLLLSAQGLDAAGALRRVAWLFNAGGLDPANVLPRETGPGKITAPTLTTKNEIITFQGWWQAFSDPPYRRRITIIASGTHTRIAIEAARKE